ncbi:MAG TPA: sulfotransferase [Pseudomonadales bacterium]|nr:sulfotransferase [Pseudomonadales bacterium]
MAARKLIETSNNYNKPYRPLPIALFNSVGRVVEKLGAIPDLNVHHLMENARKKTGLIDFGDEFFVEPLTVLVDSINREAHLTPLGKLIQKNRLESALVVRLRAQQLFKLHPEILKVDLGKIIIIAGLQRTGTTTLHRLLASDPKMRALYAWEALNPVPLPREKPGHPDARIAQAKTAEKGLAYLAPEFFAIHPVEHDAPEEDVLLLDLSFMSQSPEATLNVPTYADWLEKQDHTKAYEYLYKILQLLHWQRPAQNWVLKTPHHMEYLDVILKVFPNAYIVQTHRDPQKTTGSFCSMVSHGRGVFSDEVDAVAVARHWVRKVNRLMQLSMQVRASGFESRFIDVSYYDLLKDPIREVERIYQFAGIPFDIDAIRAAEATKEKNVQHRYGRHHYNLADFGLSKEEIEKQYGFYRQRYGIPYEK